MKIRDRDFLLRRLVGEAYKFREEPFTLKSGKTSNHYIDARTLMMNHLAVDTAAALMTAEMAMKYDCGGPSICGRTFIAAGVVLGGCSIADAFARFNALEKVYVRPQAKEHGSKQQIEGVREDWFRNGTAGTPRAILLEDVTTTGGSVLSAAKALEERGFDIAAIISLVDREDGAAEVLKDYNFSAIYTLDEIVSVYIAERDRIGYMGHP